MSPAIHWKINTQSPSQYTYPVAAACVRVGCVYDNFAQVLNPAAIPAIPAYRYRVLPPYRYRCVSCGAKGAAGSARWQGLGGVGDTRLPRPAGLLLNCQRKYQLQCAMVGARLTARRPARRCSSPTRTAQAAAGAEGVHRLYTHNQRMRGSRPATVPAPTGRTVRVRLLPWAQRSQHDWRQLWQRGACPTPGASSPTTRWPGGHQAAQPMLQRNVCAHSACRHRCEWPHPIAAPRHRPTRSPADRPPAPPAHVWNRGDLPAWRHTPA